MIQKTGFIHEMKFLTKDLVYVEVKNSSNNKFGFSVSISEARKFTIGKKIRIRIFTDARNKNG